MIKELSQKLAQRQAEVARDVFIEVAGLVVNMTGGDPQPELAGAVNRFAVSPREQDVTIHTAWGELGDENHGRRLFDSGSLWQLYEEEEGYRIRLSGIRPGQTTYKVARFTEDFTRGEVICDPRRIPLDEPLYPLQYPLDELLFINLLARGRGVEIHSCGVGDADGQGYLFVGESGAGKSTSARLWLREEGVELLSDDRIIVRREGARFWMYGTPWHGEAELSEPRRVELRRIFFLRHGEGNEIVRQTRVEAAARLFSNAFPTFYNAEGLAFTLEFLDELTKSVPCAELVFVPDGGVVDFVRRQAL
jgi:hypothetical protein